jgi:16S rRNA U516 pseudouridylate synthase RsuA-like enzyme
MIAQGRIKVNMEPVIKQGQKINPNQDSVWVDDVIVKPVSKMVYIWVNKPPGYFIAGRFEQGALGNAAEKVFGKTQAGKYHDRMPIAGSRQHGTFAAIVIRDGTQKPQTVQSTH